MRILGILAIIALCPACASTLPSKELVDARVAYQRARTSNAATYSPDRVLEAKQALDRAEAAHADDAGSFAEKRLAYVAERRSETAVSYGAYAKAIADEKAARQDYSAEQDRMRREAEQVAGRKRHELEQARDEIAAQRSDIEAAKQRLASERQARTEAVARADAAVASLKRLASVKEDARGTVITLDGAVLFVTGKAELLPLARQKLDEVAKALTELEDEQRIVVEGYTDSRGADAMNQKLSEERAGAVRAYLVTRDVDAKRIRAVGKGEADPIALNDTPEGRANNRRVEIVVQSAQKP